MSRFMNKDYKIVEKTKWMVIVPVLLIVVAIVLIACGRMNIGMDFTGGATVEFELGAFGEADSFKKTFDTEMRNILEDNYEISDQIQVSPSGSGYTYSYRLTYFFKGEYEGVDYDGKLGSSDAAHDAFINSLKSSEEGGTLARLLAKTRELVPAEEAESFNPTDSELIRVYDVGATASKTLLDSAILAIAVALVVILVYIIIRFNFLSGLAALIALIHDVLIMTALTTIFYIPVNSTFIAAVITIIGYSINASIVVFDKIRECRNPSNSAFAMASDAEVANYAIKHSFVKIFLSTLTTLIMVVAVVLFSVATIQEFVLPIIFGLISGLFSALCLAPTLWVAFRKIQANRKTAKKA